MRIRSLLCVLIVLGAGRPTVAQSTYGTRGGLDVVASGIDVVDLDLDSYGAAIGLRYWTTDRVAIGAAVGIAVSSQKDDEAVSVGGGEPIRSEVEREVQGVSLWAERHLGTDGRSMSPFYGAHAYGGRIERREDRTLASSGGTAREVLSGDGVGGGAGAFVGLEVGLGAALSISGRVGLDVRYDRYTLDRLDTPNPPDEAFVPIDGDGVSLDMGASRLSVVVRL